jgi:hypothetical protein
MTGKSVAPWSVKGIERPTREKARQSAQAAGMTVGAWIEQAIRGNETLLRPGPPTPEADPRGEVMAAAQRAEVRSLEAGVERAESRSGDMVIPVALKVQELAHRLVEIEQARVAGRTRPQFEPEPPAAPPPPPEDDFERFRVPEPEPEPEPAVARAPAADDFPTPVPPPDDDFERFKVPEPGPEPLIFAAETAIPEERPHRRAWARPRLAQPKRKSRLRRALGSVLGAVVALALGAGSAIIVLDHGELIGLPPRLVDHIADGLDRALAEGQRLARAGGDAVGDLIHDIRSLFEEERPAESSVAAPAEPKSEAAPPAPAPVPPPSTLVAAPAPPPSATPSPVPAPPPPTPAPQAGSEAPARPSPSVAAATSPPPATAPPAPPPPSMSPPPTSETTTAPSPQVSALPSPSTTTASPPPQVSALPPATAPAPSPPPTEPAQSFPTLEQPKEPAPPAREADALEKAARQGDVKAQYELGVLAVQPEVGQPDYGKAAYWFREAAV